MGQVSNLVPVSEANQPQLFSADDFEAGEELVAAFDKTDKSKRTGRTLERRGTLVDAILERIAAGVSQRKLAKVFGVSRQSIRMLCERAEDVGKLEPLRKRIANKLLTTAELAADEMVRRLEENPEAIDFQKLGIAGVNIATEKANLLTGSATSITAKLVVDQVALGAKLRELKKGAIDV